MLRGKSAWTTILWLVPYTCGVIRGNVWPNDSEYFATLGSLCFLVGTGLVCEILLRWYRHQIIQEVRRSRDPSMDNLEEPIE